MNLYIDLRPILTHGFDQVAAILRDSDTGRAVVSVIRWTGNQARCDAHAWARTRGYRIVDASAAPPQGGVVPAARMPEKR